MNCLEEPQFNS